MTAVWALAALLPALAGALPCVQFDADFNLYAFGGEDDVSLGASDAWASPQAKPLSKDGRPPWNGQYTQCLLSQNANAMYVLGADASDVGVVYIYDFVNDKWSKQATSGAPKALQNSRSSAVLDHDTNVIFTMAGGGSDMYELDMESITTTAGGSLQWSDVRKPSFNTDNYNVTAALASNHINYFGVPDTPAGSTNMFVIHYSYFQPSPATYAAQGGSSFPDSSGQAVSFLAANSTPYQNLFVPNDFSNTYVVTHWTAQGSYNTTNGAPMSVGLINSTQALPAPEAKDQQASYACSVSDCVQIDTQGNIYYMSGAVSSFAVNANAKWEKMSYQLKPQSESKPNETSQSGSGTATQSGASTSTGSNGASSSSGASQGSGAGVSARPGLVGLAVGIAALAAATVL